MSGRLFYGWILLGVAWIIYGFGISPGYYSWGLFSGSIIEELSLSRAQTGAIFGLFTFLYSGVGPLAGFAISRWGIRWLMTAGSAIAALGFFLLSSADTVIELFIYYGVLAGIGIGLSTILPCQALATNWFTKYRARAIAIIFIAGGIVGRIVTRFDVWMLDEYSWRTGWVVIAGVSAALALVAALFVRDSPADVGQHPDGRDASAAADSEVGPEAAAGTVDPRWTAGAAIRTPQFALLCLCGIGYAVPWGVVVAHGALHLADLGLSRGVGGAIIGTMVLVSIAGRLTGSLGDFIAPEKVLGVGLLVEALGVGGLLFTTGPAMAYASTIAIGLGFGASYISITVVFSNFFGRQAFPKTAGTRLLVTGIFNALAPGIAGRVFDTSGSYQSAFVVILAIGLVATLAALTMKAPKQAPQTAPATA